MNVIESTKNGLVKELKSLTQKKYREQLGLFMTEGKKLVQEALDNGYAPAYALFSSETDPLITQVEKKGGRAYLASDAAMKAACDAVTPQGVIAAMYCKEEETAEMNGLWAVLERIQDPSNVGAILRCADAMGAQGILLSPDCADVFSPKAIRAAMGSTFHVRTVVAEDFHGTLTHMKNEGFVLLAAHLKGESTLAERLGTKVAVLIGNEGNGLTDKTTALATVKYRLPMRGRAESLNASVAAGILLYEVSNRMDW